MSYKATLVWMLLTFIALFWILIWIVLIDKVCIALDVFIASVCCRLLNLFSTLEMTYLRQRPCWFDCDQDIRNKLLLCSRRRLGMCFVFCY